MEYLTEWPPKDDHSYTGSSEDNRTLDLPCPAAKRPRHGTGMSTKGKLSVEEIVLAESELPQSAAALLARWWKLKAREPSALTLERQKLIPASSNPHTLLHHIARYGQGVACRSICDESHRISSKVPDQPLSLVSNVVGLISCQLMRYLLVVWSVGGNVRTLITE